jgi:hypothetical protein
MRRTSASRAVIATVAVCALGLGAAVSCKQRQELASGTEAAGPAQRKVLGVGANYPADTRPPDQIKAELNGSVAKRRAFGWGVVAKVLHPVGLSAAVDQGAAAALPKVPTFLTWYTAEETQKIFRRFYKQLKLNIQAGVCTLQPAPASGAATALAPACDLPTLAASALADYSTQQTLAGAPVALYDRLSAQLATASDAAVVAAGLGKTNTFVKNVVLFNNTTVLHYLTHYDAVSRCVDQYKTAPPPLADPSMTEDTFGICFGANAPFPADAVTVKTHWERLFNGAQVKIANTDADALLAAFAGGDGGWKAAATTPATLPGNGIFTVRVRTVSTTNDFALVGLHVTTKEVPAWVWVSLWWSPAADQDFGADRPSSLCSTPDDGEGCAADDQQLAAFQNYKMCVVTDFKEGDPALQAAIAADDPLAPVLTPLKAVYDATGGNTWCSNQFIEEGPHETRSNCVGCHQFSAPGAVFDRTQPDGATQNVLDQQGHNFAADFMWSFTNGDDLAHTMNDSRQDIDTQVAQGKLTEDDVNRDD